MKRSNMGIVRVTILTAVVVSMIGCGNTDSAMEITGPNQVVYSVPTMT